MPPKRKSGETDGTVGDVQPRRSTRQRTSTTQAREAAAASESVTPKKAGKPAAVKKAAPKAKQKGRQGDENEDDADRQPAPPSDGKTKQTNDVRAVKTQSKSTAAGAESKEVKDPGKQYWLMKAEPESRIENGVDVRFSIDDLAAKSEPEPWDGIRNFVARNNLRAMKKGDLAFFYHSNCKEPGIAGTMEIVQEHSPDLTAHDPKCPYYDPKSKPSDPKWSVVHVEFRSKFPVPIGLKELRAMGGPGGPLEDMQMLKQSRLSVSRVSAEEWKHLVGVAEEKAQAGA
ncbi:hypothetical protein INS49_007464 [Diaporthe citri]|uniref:uncharacterized protein n=1 Tax=Diaporthe citri TaxID=83186 RepID=UPI001C7E25B7|nr:uncharacterized protein INS49_007464 [Diaporthe citri]KAG6353383.1 hypothetical protein INS49_007464 [Diaporthe citri]